MNRAAEVYEKYGHEEHYLAGFRAQSGTVCSMRPTSSPVSKRL